jgi:hypothetical protein
MHHIAENNPKNIQELSPLMPDSPWRVTQFGEEILAVITTKHAKVEPKRKLIKKS